MRTKCIEAITHQILKSSPEAKWKAFLWWFCRFPEKLASPMPSCTVSQSFCPCTWEYPESWPHRSQEMESLASLDVLQVFYRGHFCSQLWFSLNNLAHPMLSEQSRMATPCASMTLISFRPWWFCGHPTVFSLATSRIWLPLEGTQQPLL